MWKPHSKQLTLLFFLSINLLLAQFGKVDSNFTPNTGDVNFLCVVKTLKDGKILVGGDYSSFENNSAQLSRVFRLNSNGTIDQTFNAPKSVFGTVVCFAEQNDGKILVGSVSSLGGYLTRLMPDGSIDNSFFIGQGVNNQVNAIEITNEGKIIICGAFTKINGTNVSNIAQLNSDGTIDNSFNINVGNQFNSFVSDILIQPNGKIIVAGSFNNSIARLNSDGTVDNAFNVLPLNIGGFEQIQQTSEGLIYALSTNGVFYSFNHNGSINQNFTSHLTSPSVGGAKFFKLTDKDEILFSSSGFFSYDNTSRKIVLIKKNGQTNTTFKIDNALTISPQSFDFTADGDLLVLLQSLSSFKNIQTHFLKFDLESKNSHCDSVKVGLHQLELLSCLNSKGFAEAVPLHSNNNLNFTWYTHDTIINGSGIEFEKSGKYILMAKDTNGCSITKELWIAATSNEAKPDFTSNTILTQRRPGFSGHVFIQLNNRNCVASDGTFNLMLDKNFTINNFSINPHQTIGDTLFWNFNSIDADSVLEITIDVTISNLANIGDSLKISSWIHSIQEETNILNNNKSYFFPVINGYDPNDINVSPGGFCEDGYIKNSQTLTYTIRFQNTGNAEAIHINVVDSISKNLDISSFKVLASSHLMYTELYPENVLKFVFDSIVLPDSTHDEPHSHGYVVYEISPKSSLADESIINNKAEIYFDFNAAAITNNVSNKIYSDINELPCIPIIDNVISIEKIGMIYPNPSSNSNVYLRTDEVPNEIQIFDGLGNLLYKKTKTDKLNLLPLENYSAGIYYLKVMFNQKCETHKLVIE